MTTLIPISPTSLNRLRELRLWHWRQFIKLGKWAHGHENASPQFNSPKRVQLAKTFREGSNFHIMQVQLLNDFFPIDDTAEKDDSK